MPTYVYRCENGHAFELFHSISDESPKLCPECGAAAKRVPAGGAGFLFKGSGFYITDYRSKGYKDAAKKEGSGSSSEKPAPGGSSAGSSTSGGETSSKPTPPGPGSSSPSKPGE
jgi:putative FmdB family regulatory protein